MTLLSLLSQRCFSAGGGPKTSCRRAHAAVTACARRALLLGQPLRDAPDAAVLLSLRFPEAGTSSGKIDPKEYLY